MSILFSVMKFPLIRSSSSLPPQSLYLLVLIYFLSLLKYGYSTHMSNETDLLSLFAFKSNIIDDPMQVMSSWNNSVHFCLWHGVKCGTRHQRVVAIDLQSKKLTGTISSHIGNLSFIRELQLQNNSFTNKIPPEIGRLSKLKYLRLNNNSISDQIPGNISECSNLVHLDLSYNVLVGDIPKEIGILSKLETVIIHNNNLTGSISPIGNLTSLQRLSAAENYFQGNITDDFGRLQSLKIFALGINSLSGTIPASLFNLSSLSMFDVTGNQIEGTLPEDLGNAIPNLEFFNLGDNHFTGSLPASLSNATNLRYLILVQNKFTGKVPDLGKSISLEWLSISDNQLGYGDDDDLGFVASLVNATNLQVLGVNVNNFGGVLPDSIGNLSKILEILYLDNNQITGTIPSGVVNLVNLQSLNIQGNQLTGNIPGDIGKLQNLQDLNLINNKLTGYIPSSLGNLSFLNTLILGTNNLEGTIPSSLGRCSNLQMLFLSENNLSGNIPKEIMEISSLSTYFHLASNMLTGSLPSEVGFLVNLGSFDVSGNMLSGEIPSTMSKCTSLETLRLGNNFFSGEIPSSLSSLRGIQELDLSNNTFSGKIPGFLEDFSSLRKLNLSFNNFEGIVPTQGIFENSTAISVLGNTKLCGGIAELQLPKCNFYKSTKIRSNKTLILAISLPVGILCLFLLFCALYIIWFRKKRTEASFDLSKESPMRLSYQNLLKATDGFSSSNLIGIGSFGSVYKGVINGNIVAVKVLNLLREGATKSFISECEALRNIRHRNLVKVLTACSALDYKGSDFKALVYEYMVNGSLEEWLHLSSEKVSRKRLSFIQRLDIGIDVACALDYLHNNQGQARIVHCDLKPSNVLLDKEMIGHVGDFGLTKFIGNGTQDLHSNDMNSIGVRGTIGYAAPEYGMGSEVSTQGDVYSFGILLLEMFTGKKPTHDMFMNGSSLHSFVKDALHSNTIDIADPSLLSEEENEEDSKDKYTSKSLVKGQKQLKCLCSVLELGINCSVQTPNERMEISDVIHKLHVIKSSFLELDILEQK